MYGTVSMTSHLRSSALSCYSPLLCSVHAFKQSCSTCTPHLNSQIFQQTVHLKPFQFSHRETCTVTAVPRDTGITLFGLPCDLVGTHTSTNGKTHLQRRELVPNPNTLPHTVKLQFRHTTSASRIVALCLGNVKH